MKSFRNFLQRMHPIHPIGPYLMFQCVSYYLGAFGTVCCVTTLSSKCENLCKNSCHEVASEFFATNSTDPPHWNLNKCFGVYCAIWMHSGLFGCLTKLDAKRAEVVQKFVPWSLVGIFRNKRTRSTLLDPYLMFHCVLYYLGAFGTVCCVTTLSSKQAKLVQKFMPRSRVGIFHNERTRSTPLDSKLMFWCVLYYLGAFGTDWLAYKTRCKTGWSGAKLRAMKSCRNFSQQTTRSTL